MGVTSFLQSLGLAGRQLVGSPVFPTLLHEYERAVIGYEMIFKEIFGLPEALRKKTPEAPPTHLALGASQALHRALGMLGLGLFDFPLQAHPVAHGRNLAKGNPRLGHAEGTRVHPEKDYLLLGPARQFKVLAVNFPRIIQRVIYVGGGQIERQCVDRPCQFLGRLFERFRCAHLARGTSMSISKSRGSASALKRTINLGKRAGRLFFPSIFP